MRAVRLIIGGVLVVATLLLPNAADARPHNPVAGQWATIDDVDGSQLNLRITNGRQFQVFFHDDGASVCQDAGYGFVPATLKGKATVTSTAPFEFEITGDVVCHTARGRRAVLPDFTLGFAFDSGADHLFDTVGECWARPGQPECSAP